MNVDLDQAWRTVDWQAVTREAHVDGRRVRYVDVGSGSLLVLVHGQGGCWQWWLRVLPLLASSYRVVALDLAGYGDSEAALGDAFHAQVRTVVGLIDHLGERTAVIAGHSMGGFIATAVAARHPERVSALIVENGGPIELGRLPLAALIIGMRLAHVVLARRAASTWLVKRQCVRDAFFATAVADRRTVSSELADKLVPAMAAHGFVETMYASVRALDSIDARHVRCPTLVLWGGADRILPVGTARPLAERLGDARLVVLDGVGHCPMVEDPLSFVAELTRFLDEVAPSGQ